MRGGWDTFRIFHPASGLYARSFDGRDWGSSGAFPFHRIERARRVARALLRMPHVKGPLLIHAWRPCPHHRREQYRKYADRCWRRQARTFPV